MRTVLLLSRGVGRQCVQSGALLQVIFLVTWHCSKYSLARWQGSASGMQTWHQVTL